MTAPTTFERVYLGIKAWLTAGHYRPGDRLEPSHLSEQLNSSVTPVRDALHRLTGERLVEAPRSEGFRVPLASEFMLRHLYAWHRDLLLLALAARKPFVPTSNLTFDPQKPPRIAHEQALFMGLAEATGNFEHVQALRSLLERLEPYQRLEGEVLDQLEEEASAIALAVEQGDRRALRSLLVRYHRRRSRVVPDLVAMAAQR